MERAEDHLNHEGLYTPLHTVTSDTPHTYTIESSWTPELSVQRSIYGFALAPRSYNQPGKPGR